MVIVVKYLTFIMRADNRGEGGILALLALLRPPTGRVAPLVTLGLFGAALLYGDGVITPAISVLSAVEGLEVAAPSPGAVGRAADRRHPDGTVPRAASRDRPRGRRLRPDHARLVRQHRARGSAVGRRRSRRSWPRSTRSTPSASSSTTASCTGFSCSARSCSASPAARRCTPTWGTSACGPSAWPGTAIVFPALLLNYFGQGALLLATCRDMAGPAPPRASSPPSGRSTRSSRRRCSTRWCSSRPPRPWSRRKRSSPAPSR